MHRIDDPTAVAVMPAPRPQGVPGFFTRGEPGVQNPTVVRFEWLNTCQEEISHVITQAGIALNKLDNTQLFQAIQALMAAAVDDPPDDGFSYTRVHNRWVSGGIVRQDVTLAANVTVGGALSIGLGGSPFYLMRSAGWQTVMHAPDWYDQYEEATGHRYWVGNLGSGAEYLMTLQSGALWVKGQVTAAGGLSTGGHTHTNTLGVVAGATADSFSGNWIQSHGNVDAYSGSVNAGYIQSTGDIFAAGSIRANAHVAAGASVWIGGEGSLFSFRRDPGDAQYVFHQGQSSANWTDKWVEADGQRQWLGGSSEVLMSLNGLGDLWAARNIACSSEVRGFAVYGEPGGVFCGWGNGITSYPDGRRDHSYNGDGNTWTWNNGTVSYFGNGTGIWGMEAWPSWFCTNYVGPVAGTRFVETSDERGKANIAPSSYGLAEVLRLRAVSYTRPEGADPHQTEIGFVAQDVQPIIPEAVVAVPHLEGREVVRDDSVLGLHQTAILAAVCNAIREMDARMRAVEAR